MHRRPLFGLLIAAGLLIPSGCTVLRSVHESTRQTMRLLRPSPGGYRDPTGEFDPEWAEVGEIGRGDQPRESEPDHFWSKYFMSEKARSIERNFGIDHTY